MEHNSCFSSARVESVVALVELCWSDPERENEGLDGRLDCTKLAEARAETLRGKTTHATT